MNLVRMITDNDMHVVMMIFMISNHWDLCGWLLSRFQEAYYCMILVCSFEHLNIYIEFNKIVEIVVHVIEGGLYGCFDSNSSVDFICHKQKVFTS